MKFSLRSIISILMFLIAAMNIEASYPIVHNYKRAAYNGGPQNWCVRQSTDGSMLFGNTYGLLTFDSRQWRLIGTSNGTTVRCIYIENSKKRVYIGATGEFGYFAPDKNGVHRFTSLLSTIATDKRIFSEIWNIHDSGKGIWFQGDNRLFCYNGKSTYCIDTAKKITTSSLINSTLYVAFIDGSICTVQGNTLHKVTQSSVLSGMRICSILELTPGNILIVTALHGLYLYNGSTITPYHTDIDPFLRDNQAFCAAKKDNFIVIGTVGDGAVMLNLMTGDKTFINMACGLQNNTVLSASFDMSGNLWLGLDNGIDYVRVNSPVSNLFGETGNFGAGYASMVYENALYLGTNQGLYKAPDNASKGLRNSDISLLLKGQIWGLDTVEGSLLVSGDAGLFEKRGATLSMIEGVPGAWHVTPLKKHPGFAIASTYEHLYLLRHDAGGWTSLGKIKGYSEAGGDPIEDNKGNIWISHWIKGVYRLKPNSDFSHFDKVKLYNSKKGFPSDRDNLISDISGEVIFTSKNGLYRYDALSDSMVRDATFSALLPGDATSRLFEAPTGEIISASPRKVTLLTPLGNGHFDADSTSFRHLVGKMISGFEHFSFPGERRVIAASQDGFFDIDLNHRIDSIRDFPVFISSIKANRDSTIYSDLIFPFPENKKIRLTYSLNSLYIEYVSPEYASDDAVEYTYILENYDKEWCAPTHDTSKEYTRLSEGTYTFRVRANNTFTGKVSECALTFTILPPWYRSTIAIMIYIILAITILSLLAIAAKHYSQRVALDIARRKEEELEAMKKVSEREALEKDIEIERLKSEQLENDIKNKSGELNSITMNVVRKNEILLDIESRLEKIRKNMADNADPKVLDRQLMKIKELIRQSISQDDSWRNFTRTFDIVYENYTKRLLEKFPTLTTADQRLCAYLKMGLTSKEIAPLLNISYRSVEMTRYRLRKKMGLTRNESLSEYLRNF